jgi:hypothetical protein
VVTLVSGAPRVATSGKAVNLFEFALLILLGILWGSPSPAIPPITLVTVRVLIAAATLWMFIGLSGYKIPGGGSVLWA